MKYTPGPWYGEADATVIAGVPDMLPVLEQIANCEALATGTDMPAAIWADVLAVLAKVRTR